MANLSKGQWVSLIISDGKSNGGVVSVQRIEERTGRGHQHCRKTVETVLTELAERGVNWKFTDTATGSRMTDKQYADMLDNLAQDLLADN